MRYSSPPGDQSSVRTADGHVSTGTMSGSKTCYPHGDRFKGSLVSDVFEEVAARAPGDLGRFLQSV